MQPGMHGAGPVGRGVEGGGVGPLADRGLNEALGLAVGFGRVGPGALVPQAVVGNGAGEQLAFEGGAVVGHDALGGDAMRREPVQGVVEESHGAFLALVGHDGGEGQARGVVDGDVEVLPAGAALPALAAAVAGDAVADAVDAAELLDVDVDQLARALALVAENGGLGIERPEAAEAEAAQLQADGGPRQAQRARDGRAGAALAAQRFDPSGGFRRQAGRAVMGPGRTVPQPVGTLGGEAVAPFPHRGRANPGRRGDPVDAPAGSQPIDHQHSTARRASGILMGVHPGLRAAGCWPRNHSLPAQPRRDNLHSSDS